MSVKENPDRKNHFNIPDQAENKMVQNKIKTKFAIFSPDGVNAFFQDLFFSIPIKIAWETHVVLVFIQFLTIVSKQFAIKG